MDNWPVAVILIFYIVSFSNSYSSATESDSASPLSLTSFEDLAASNLLASKAFTVSYVFTGTAMVSVASPMSLLVSLNSKLTSFTAGQDSAEPR